MLLISNTLYGTTFYGGLHDAGTVFKINTDGSGFATLHHFNYTDGQEPQAGLTLYNNVLYSTTTGGGTYTYGTVFRINLDGSGFTSLLSFANWANPYGGLVATNNVLYGFGRLGGDAALHGTVYRLGTGGGGYTEFFDFNGTNGWAPYSTPVLAGNTLFGTTFQGGDYGGGNVFRIDIDGTHFTNLFSFPAQSGANTTGANPENLSGLVVSGSTLYGTTSVSGTGGQGTVFQLHTDGTGFTVLHSFQFVDGGQPAALALSGGTLYGLAETGIQGTSTGNGGVFALVFSPTLHIALDGRNAVLTWDDPSFSLYQTSNPNGVFTQIIGARTPYTNAISGTQEYFGLR